MQIVNLADYQHLIPELALLHFQEWSYLRPGETLEERTRRLRSTCGPGLPSVVVALDVDQLGGSAMLVANDLPSHSHLTPWLAGVYVKPDFRRRGLARLLISHVASKARVLGFDQLYLYTPADEQLYTHMGWTVLERARHEGFSVTIMSKSLE